MLGEEKPAITSMTGASQGEQVCTLSHEAEMGIEGKITIQRSVRRRIISGYRRGREEEVLLLNTGKRNLVRNLDFHYTRKAMQAK